MWTASVTKRYAADELGNVYYFGKAVYLGRRQHYIERDYKKAAEYYLMAIRNSNPHLQSSCWSLGQTLARMKCEPSQEDERDRKVMHFYELAGDYPAAYGSRSNAMLAKDDRLQLQ